MDSDVLINNSQKFTMIMVASCTSILFYDKYQEQIAL